ncbi:hypothetical protein GQR36_09265 [Enterococcus termitis]
MKRTNKIVNLMITAMTIFIIVSVFFAIRGFSVIRKTTTASGQDFLLQSTEYVGKVIQLSMKNRHQSLNYLAIDGNLKNNDDPAAYLNSSQSALTTFFDSLNGEADSLFTLTLPAHLFTLFIGTQRKSRSRLQILKRSSPSSTMIYR